MFPGDGHPLNQRPTVVVFSPAMTHWDGPVATPIHEQAAARGVPPPVDSAAGNLRRDGFDVPAHIPDVALYVADAGSPTGYRWQSDAWDDIDWWLNLDDAGAASVAAILRHVVGDGGIRARNVAAAAEPTKHTASDLIAYVCSLPLSVRVVIDETAAGDLSTASAQEIHRAIHLGFVACCDRVAAKFRYRLAT